MIKHFTRYYGVLIICLFAAIFISDYWYQQQQLDNRPLMPAQHNVELLNALCTDTQCPNIDSLDGIDILPIESIHFPVANIERLKRGEILQTINNQNGVTFYALLESTGNVAVIGPIDPLEEPHSWYTSVFYVLLAVAIFSGLVPLFREIASIKKAADRFTKTGEFDALPTGYSAFFKPVNLAFASMTNKIAQLLALQKELADTLSHEIRTPLSRIRFAEQTLTSENILPVKESMEIDLKEIDDLVDEYLTFSKQEHEEPRLEFDLQSPVTMIKQHVELFNKYTRADIEFKVETDCSFKYDQRKLSRAIKNLIDNGCKYSRSKVRVTLSKDEALNRIVINIEDDGPGIPENDIDDLFLPYTRIDRSKTPGFGLGLAITRKIILWHNGSIAIKSSKTLGGANFEVGFPL